METIDAQVDMLTWNYNCLRQEAIVATAQKVGYSDFPWRSDDEVLKQIEIKDKKTADALYKFLNADKALYEFCRGCRQRNTPSPLDGDDYIMMTKLISEKENARREWAKLIE